MARARLLRPMPSVPLYPGGGRETALPDRGDGALLLVDLEAEPVLQERRHRRHHSLPCRLRPHIDVAVIGVSAEPMSPSFQFLVQIVQQQIGQQRRQRAALRRALVPFAAHPSAIIPACKKRRTMRSRRVSPMRRARRDIRISWLTRSKEFLEIQVHDDLIPVRHVFPGLSQRMVRAAAGAEAEARSGECRIQPRFQDLCDRLLHQTIHHGGDAQLAHPAARFGDLHPPHRLRPVAAVQQPRDQRSRLSAIQPAAR